MGILAEAGLDFGGLKPDNEAYVYTQEFVPIKDIRWGMIITDDNRYLKVLEISPINFGLRNPSEQEAIILNYAKWLKVCPNKMQIKVVTRKADTTGFVNTLMERMKKEKSLNCKKLGDNYAKLITELSSNSAVARHFYIIFEYEPFSEMQRLTDPYEIAKILETKKQSMIPYFRRMGNTIVAHKNEDLFLAQFVYDFYNQRSYEIEGLNRRIERIYKDTQKISKIEHVKYEQRNVDARSFFCPKGMNFEDKEYSIVDGMYISHFYIPSEGYPLKVYRGWITTLIALGEGVDIDFYITKESRVKTRSKVSRKMSSTSAKLGDRNASQIDYEQIRNALWSAEYIKACISNGETPFYLSTLITIKARTYEELVYKRQGIRDFLISNDIETRDCDYMEESAFKMSEPFLKTDTKIYGRSKRNIMTSGLSSCYPFTAFEMLSDDGVVIGTNNHNNSLCIIDPFNTKQYKNANMLILGTTGAGKTFTELLMALRLRVMDTQCFILSPDKAHEYKRSCDAVGGSFIKVAPSSKDCINIMDIRPTVSPIDELLDGYREDSKTWLADKVQQLITFFELLIPDLTNEEQQLLDTEIMKTYEAYGITTDNDSLYIDSKDKDKGLKEMPIIEDLYKRLKANDKISKRIPNIISQFVTGSARNFNNRTNVDLENKYIVFDLEELSGSLLPAGMFVVLDFVWSRVKEDRTKKKMIFIDEGWQLIGSGANIKAAEFVQHIFKVIRGYGGGAVLSTQDITDLFSLENGKYGSSILSASKTKIVLQLEDDEAELVRKKLKLTKSEIREIVNYPRGQALVCANTNHIPVKIIPSKYEHDLITTDRTQLENLLKEKQEQQA